MLVSYSNSISNYAIVWIVFAVTGGVLLRFIKAPKQESIRYWIGFWARACFLFLEGYWIANIFPPYSYMLMAVILIILIVYHLRERSQLARQIRFQADNAVLWLGFVLSPVRYAPAMPALIYLAIGAVVGGLILFFVKRN